MQPTGRRRNAAITCLAFLFLFATTARAAVLGVDFGTLHIKAALIKPGIPLDIVLTKDSKRKEIAAVAFKPNRDGKNNIIAEVGTFPDRAYGGDALALQGRISDNVFPNLKHLLGLQMDESAEQTMATYNARYPALQIQHMKELGSTGFKSSAFVGKELPFSVEELIGMELVNIRRNAEAMAGAGSVVEDAVITIPAFYTADEKRAIAKAASFAGLYVNALITDGLAVGLDYAKSRTFPEVTKGEKPEYHLVYDMGAGSTTATVMRFQSRSVKDTGRYNKTVQEVAVAGAGWDRTLGGDSMNHVIMKEFVQRLMTKPVFKSRGTQQSEITSNGRIVSRIYKEAEKVRQVLSANTETSSGFEEILPDIDFRTKLSRTEFEKLTTSFAERVQGPIVDALDMAKLTMKDIKSVILHGGAVRTPFVQKKLEEIVGDTAKLRSNVNADESAVFGAAFKAASLSPSFKVKEIRDSDLTGYPITLTYTEKGKERKKPLFTANSAIGSGASTKQVSFKDKDDFSFGFAQTVGGQDRPVSSVQTNNVTASVQELVSKFGCDKDGIATKMNIRLSNVYGLPEVVSGSVSCEVDDSKSGSVGDTVKDWFGFGKKKDQQPLQDDAEGTTEAVDTSASTTSTAASDSASSKSSSSSSTSASSKASETPKKRIESIAIAFTTQTEGNVQPSVDQLTRMQERLQDFDKSDDARVAREEAQNVLEAYTYHARDFLSNADFESVSTQAQRDAVSKLLQTTRDWMDAPGEAAKATTEVLKEKLSALRKLVEPIKSRRQEGSSRPEKVTALKKSLDETGKLLLTLESQVQSAVAAQSKASLLASSSTTESSASSSTDAESSATAAEPDDFADLEDAEASSTTTAAPKYSQPSDFNPYASLDLSSIRETYDSVNKWLTEREAEQKKLKPFDEPAFTIKELEAKAGKLASAMQDLVYKQMRAAKSTSSSSKKAKSTSKTKAAKKSKSTSSADAEEAETTDVPRRGKPGGYAKGDESIDELFERGKKDAEGEEKRPRDEL